MQKSVLLCIISFLLFSCKRENALDCFKSNGHYYEEVRDIGPFKSIRVENKINVKIIKGPQYRLLIKTNKNLASNISTKVMDDVLTIENLNTCNFVRGYKHEINIEITTPNVSLVTNIGVGKVEFSDNYVQDTLVARIESSGDIIINGTFNQIRTSSHGNGDMIVSGEANSFYVYSNGINFVHAENLIVKDYVFIESLTLGDCYINAKQLDILDYHLESSGNLYFSGQPKQIREIRSGKGKAIQL